VQQNPSLADVTICTVTDCGGFDSLGGLMFIYPPGAPNVSQIEPSSGPSYGGTPATILGQNLGFAIDAKFGTATVSFLPGSFSYSGGSLPAILDEGSTSAVGGLYTPQASDPTHYTSPLVTVDTVESYFTGDVPTNDSGYNDVNYYYYPSPTVTSVTPTMGPAVSNGHGVTLVTVYGTNFFGGGSSCDVTSVAFGGIEASLGTLASCSDTSFTITEPGGIAGNTVDVQVSTEVDTSPLSSGDQYTFVAAPTVTSVTPNGGSAGTQYTVAVTGTGFFGGTGACDVSAIDFVTNVDDAANTGSISNCSDTAFTFTSPVYDGGLALPQTADVLVTTNHGGQSAATSADQYTYS
jgi:hypothetical protein